MSYNVASEPATTLRALPREMPCGAHCVVTFMKKETETQGNGGWFVSGSEAAFDSTQLCFWGLQCDMKKVTHPNVFQQICKAMSKDMHLG